MKAEISRRDFLRTSSLAAAGIVTAGKAPFILTHPAEPDDVVRVGVIGCGGRGTGAMLNVLGAGTRVIYPQSGYHTEDVAQGTRAINKNVEIYALADLFQDRLDRCKKQLDPLGIKVPEERCFVGFDAFKQLLAIPEINYVILAEPPHFRPEHLLAAVKAGKNVFAEKPIAVDGPGVRTVFEAAELARTNKLGIACGTQRRHEQAYVETVKRLQDGAIGDIHTGRAYWNGGVIWSIARTPAMSDLEWQIRNWNYFTWMSGDHIVEQHVHNLDVINWVLGKHPVRAWGIGGRQARIPELHGHVYDHFAVEYEYDNGVRMFSQCRQIDTITSRVEEGVEGSKGSSDCKSWIKSSAGDWKFTGRSHNPYEQEHIDLINSIRRGEPINDAFAIAESTLTGIMGRESAYSGEPITWEQALNSTRKLGPTKYEMGAFPFPEVAIPGKYVFA